MNKDEFEILENPVILRKKINGLNFLTHPRLGSCYAFPDAEEGLQMVGYSSFQSGQDERYASCFDIIKESRAWTYFFPEFDTSDDGPIQYEPDDITIQAQCREDGLDEEKLNKLIENLKSGNKIKNPCIGVFVDNKVYIVVGNHRIQVTKRLGMTCPLLLVAGEEL